MRGNRLISTIREFLGRSLRPGHSEPVADIPPVPLPADIPAHWRRYRSMAGPYERFALGYPRNWESMVAESGDPVHLSAPELDLSITVSANPEAVFGPQGVIDLIESMALARGLQFSWTDVAVDRWGEDGWAGSWAWQDQDVDGSHRTWRVLVMGHDQGSLIALVNGAQQDFSNHLELCDSVLATIALPPAALLAPENFPLALCELLNDRRSRQDPIWYLGEEGHLRCEELVVRLANIYRSYLLRQNLEEVAGLLDLELHAVGDPPPAEQGWEEVRERLRVVLRREDAIRDLDVVSVPLPGGLVACPVLDSDRQITFIPSSQASVWGLDSRAVLTWAVAALDAESSVHLIELRDTETDFLHGFRIAADDGYDSGRLLCPSLRSTLEETLEGPLLVAMPGARAVMVLRDSAQSRALLKGAALRSYPERARPLSDGLWLWTEAGLEPLES
ncbi:MAG: hypothetical protein CMP23_09150 [Rickettsiales bacterium]|nr:hypothetical protein [Rickettsiales bacterium]